VLATCLIAAPAARAGNKSNAGWTTFSPDNLGRFRLALDALLRKLKGPIWICTICGIDSLSVSIRIRTFLQRILPSDIS